MTEDYYQNLNGDLGVEFNLFAMEHPEWIEKNIPDGAILVFQTDDPKFNSWTRRVAEHNQKGMKPRPPMVLVHISEMAPAHSRIVKMKAETVEPYTPLRRARAGRKAKSGKIR